jgi:hypothetical protein
LEFIGTAKPALGKPDFLYNLLINKIIFAYIMN